MKILRWIVFACVLALFSATTLPARAVPANAALARLQALAASVKSPHVTSMQAQAHTAAWTVLVYMAADNDLESYGIADLNEMEFIGSTENLNIVVQVDRSAQYDSTNGNWSGARRYFMTQDTDLDNVASQQVGDLGVINMGDPTTLKDFIDWGVKTYPAQHYGLVIWDHGGSWLGVGIDDSANDDALKLPELDSALKDSLADSKLAKFDLVGFDACLMGSIEVYRTLAPYANYAVASPELIPGQGWDYAGALGAIADDPTIDAPTFGHAIVDSFNTFYTQVVTNYDYFSLGLVDLSQTGTVVSALDSFTGTANGAGAGEAIARARSKALVFGAFDDPQYADVWAATDMLGLMQQVQTQSKDAKVLDASNAVIDAGQKMIMYHLSSKTLADSQGVSIYFPRTSTFFTDKDRDTRYGQDTPSDLSPWQKFLGTFYSLFTGSNPLALITSATSENNQASFKLSFSTGGLSEALFYIALKLDNKPILVDYRRFDVGDFPSPGPVEPTVTWTKTVPVVSDGTTQVPALLIKDRRNPLRGIINGTFVPQNGDPQVAVQVLFDLTDPAVGKSMSVWGIRDSLIGPMPSQINAKPGDKFIPAWLSLGANGQINTRSSGTTLTFTSQPLTYFTIDAPEAVYDIGVQAINPAGIVAINTTEAQVSSNGTLTVDQPTPPKKNDDNTPESPTEPPPVSTSAPVTPPPASSSSSSGGSTTVGSPAGISPVGSSNVHTVVGEPLTTPFEVKIVDSHGNGVPGTTVTYSAPSSGPSGTFAPPVVYAPTTLDQMVAFLSGANTALAQRNDTNTVTAQTGSDGKATATTFTPNTTAGNYIVTATVSNGLTLEFQVTNNPGPGVNIEAISGTPQSAVADTAFDTALQAGVTDEFGNAVPDVTVTFSTIDPDEGTGASFDDGISVQVQTNELGIATAPTLTANPYAGDFTVDATIDPIDDGPVPTATFALTITSGEAASISFISGPSTSTVVTQSFDAELEVVVYDSSSNLVTSGSVMFVGPGTGAGVTFDDAEGERYITVPIDSSGHAFSGPITATTQSGTFNVYAIIGEVSSDPFELTSTADVATAITTNAGTPQSTAVSTAFATALKAKVTDQYGNGVAGASVTFSSADGGEAPGATYASSGSSADVEETNSDGIATASTLTANSITGDFSISATTTDVEGSATFNLTNLPGDPASLDLVGAAEEEVTTVGTAFPDPLEVIVYDQYNNVVPGAQIHFSAPLSGPSGSFADAGELTGASAPYRDTAVTSDASGSALPSTFTADTEAGDYSVHVTYDDDDKDIHLELFSYLTNLPAGPANVATVNGASGQSAVVDGTFANPLTVKVTDQYGNPVKNIHVVLTAPTTGASGTFEDESSGSNVTEGDTDVDGLFTPPSFITNFVAGSYQVTVDTPAYTLTQPAFSLTNTPGSPAAVNDETGTVSVTVGQTYGSLIVSVADSYGNGVPGVDVTFDAPNGESGPSGTFASTNDVSETVTTDSSGVATSSEYTANETAGNNYMITASTPGATSALLLLSNLPDSASDVEVYSGDDQQKELGGDYGSLVALVTDQYGNAVSGVSVNFSAPSSDASGTFAGTGTETETQVTAGNGRATSTAFTANNIAGNYTVSASAASTFASFSLANLNPAPHTTGISPTSFTLGDSPITTVTINGSNFINGVSVPRFDGSDRTASGTTSSQIILNLVAGDLDTAGQYVITVFNPFTSYVGSTPAGSESEEQTFTIYNPTPELTALQTTTLTAGDSSGSMTVTGSGFVSGAKVHWLWTDGGGDHDITLSTTYDSATQLTYNYTSANIDDGKNVKVEVHNPDPVNATSNQLDLTINNPVPEVTSATDYVFISSSDTNIDVFDTGDHYVSSSVVSVDIDGSGSSASTEIDTTFVDSGHLQAVIPAALLDHVYSVYVSVANPAPGGGTSSAVIAVNVRDPEPTITSVSPTSVDQNTGFTLTITGTNFVANDSDVIFNGQTITSGINYSNIPTELSVSIDSGSNTATGDVDVQVVNISGVQSGGAYVPVSSNTKTVTVLAPNPAPVLDSISPTSACQGSPEFTLTLDGSNFVDGAMIVWRQGSNSYVITPTSSSATQLVGTITADLLTTQGSVDVWVYNPAPPTGGQISDMKTFTISDGSSTINVDDGGDSGPGTLRQAVADACDGQSIHIGTTVTLSSTITLNKNVSIDGATEGTWNVIGNGSSPIFKIPSGVTVSIESLDMSGAGGNGAIDNDGTVNLNNVYIHDNSTRGINNTGTVDITYSTLQDNGGNSDNGAGISNSGTLTAYYVSFKDNGTGLAAKGGGLYNSGTATLRNSAFDNNSAAKGGAAYNSSALKLVNVSFYNAAASNGAGVYNESGTAKLNFVAAVNVTGGQLLSGSGFEIKNSVLSGSSSICENGNFSGTFSGVNFGEDTNCGTTFTGTSSDANLGGSAEYNGVLYFAVDVDGPANNTATDCKDTDGTTVTDSVNGKDRPQGSACEPGPAENDEP